MAIIAARKMLSDAMAEGASLPMSGANGEAVRYDDLVTIDAVTAPEDWRTGWVKKQIERRAESAWSGKVYPSRLKALL